MGILMDSTDVNLVTANYQQRRAKPELFGAMSAPGDAFYSDTLHTIAINTRETEYSSIVEPIPIVLRTYQQFQPNCYPVNGYGYPQSLVASVASAPCVPEVEKPSTSIAQSPIKEEDTRKVARPPKKKWIKEYLEEEPKSPVSVRLTGVSVTRSNGVVRPTSPVLVTPSAPAPLEPVLAPVAPIAPVVNVAPSSAPLDFVQEHSRPRNTNISHGLPQIPSPPSVSSNGSGSSSNGSSGSVPRAGTREVHNKLEKNRRAHLKECFELLKRQLPATPDDKKTSNLSILGSAIRYIQVLRRKERECEHEMERLAREKIAAQQRLATLNRDVTVRTTPRPRSIDPVSEDKEREENLNGQILGLPISIISSPTRSAAQMESSPPRTLNLSTKLRTLPIQITPTTSQVVRTSYGTRHNTLTLTTIAPADGSLQHNCQENGVTTSLSSLVHPAQIHLPLSQVVSSGGLVVGPAALQLLSTSAGLRVIQAPSIHTNGVTSDSNRVLKENGVVSPPPASTEGSVVVSGLTPIVVSQPATHLLQTHTLTHKMVETQMVTGGVAPLTLSAQYLSATAIVKPVVVVSEHARTREHT
ncbi:max-binding protein MNT-like isoform X1 [Pararge aegeria]|uniref:max-binding protein MNT-like isoform X1 n=1 Tax=Pararge aegeria TaxID=116150 RepID=UPI0019D18931|nr:max-binding protein MNT-like isoform X1 [Pararge aegeria]XP_039752261.1 max-binding protein MNT-like isoform X1 [Pararge aegeria]